MMHNYCKLANITRGSILVGGGASDAPTAYDAKADWSDFSWRRDGRHFSRRYW